MSERIELNDISQQLRARSDEELKFCLANGQWPADDELVSTENQQTQ